MSFYDSIKTYGSGISLLVASIISIGISAWQFQNDDGGVNFGGVNWDSSICNSYPLDMLRPVSVKINGQDNSSYCGYSNGNTGYRLAIAIVMLLFSIATFLRLLEQHPAIFNACFWALYSLWFLAFGLDISAIANGQSACKDVFDKYGTCNNAIYGVSIAIDVAIIMVLSVFLYFQVQSLKDGSSGNAI